MACCRYLAGPLLSMLLLALVVWLRADPAVPTPCILLGHLGCDLSGRVYHADTTFAYRWFMWLAELHLSAGHTHGFQFAALQNGTQIVDLAGGHDHQRDPDYGARTFESNFLYPIVGASRFVEAVAVAHLVDRGLLSYDAPVARFWPEFAATDARKAAVTVSDVLRDEAGMAWLDQPLSLAELKDAQAVSDRLARQPHNFDGERVRSQHLVTRGSILGEIIIRIDPEKDVRYKRRLNGWIHKEIAHRIRADFWSGWNKTHERKVAFGRRVATAMPPSPLRAILLAWFGGAVPFLPRPLERHLSQDSVMLSYQPSFLPPRNRYLHRAAHSIVPCYHCNHPFVDDFANAPINDPVMHSFELPSVNAVSSALSLARFCSLMANRGRFDKDELIGYKAIKEALSDPTAAFDHALERTTNVTKGGFVVWSNADLAAYFGRPVYTPQGKEIYAWGSGGVMTLFSPARRLAAAYVTNTMLDTILDARGFQLFEEAAKIADGIAAPPLPKRKGKRQWWHQF